LIPNWDNVALGKKEAPCGWVRCHCKFAPQFSAGVREAIYIVRHPMDVMLSAYRYNVQYHGWTDSLDSYINRFIEFEGEPDNLQLESGTWNENVESWLRLSVVIIRYEDLLHDPYDTLRKVLGSNVTSEAICDAVGGATRERMMALDTQKFVGPEHLPSRFRELMSVRQMSKAAKAFGRVMEKMDYEV
jgi:hypothetical protein